MCDLSGNKLGSLACYSVLWGGYRGTGMGCPRIAGDVGLSTVFPHGYRFHQAIKPKPTFKNYRVHLDSLTPNQVIWNPCDFSSARETCDGITVRNLSTCRMLLDGPMGLFWYCRERVLAQARGNGGHSGADSLDWSIQSVTEHGITHSLISHPTRRDWAAIPNPPEVTREGYKKSMSMSESLKKMYTNLSSKFSGLSIKTSNYDYMKKRPHHYERREMGEAGPSKMSTSKTRTFTRSHSTRDPPARRHFSKGNGGGDDNDDEYGASMNFSSITRDWAYACSVPSFHNFSTHL